MTDRRSNVRPLPRVGSGPTTSMRRDSLRVALDPFVSQHKLAEPVKAALQIVQEQFVPVSPVQELLEEDPETGEQWVELSFQVSGEPADVLRRYKEYTRRWIAAVPPHLISKVRVTCQLV